MLSQNSNKYKGEEESIGMDQDYDGMEAVPMYHPGESHAALIHRLYSLFGEPSVDSDTGNVLYEDGPVSVEIGDRMLVRVNDETAVEQAAELDDVLGPIEPRGYRIEGGTDAEYIEANGTNSYEALDDMR